MNCKKVELYMNALFDNELPTKDSLEIVDHIENCQECQTSWDLNRETKVKFVHFVDSIDVPKDIVAGINQRIYPQKNIFLFKPAFIMAAIPAILAAVFVFVLNTGEFSTQSEVHKIHSNSSHQLISNDINQISKYLGINLKNSHFIAFDMAAFKIHGATHVPLRNINVVAFKNDKGHKVSLCFLPKDFKILNHSLNSVNGLSYKTGKHKESNIAYFNHNERTIALISNDLTHEEMINLALPLIEEEV